MHVMLGARAYDVICNVDVASHVAHIAVVFAHAPKITEWLSAAKTAVLLR